MATLQLILIIVGLAFGIAEEAITRGRSLAGWGVVAIALALLLAHLGA